MDHKLMETQNTSRDALLLSQHSLLAFYCVCVGGVMKKQRWPHTHTHRCASVSFNTDMCSGFMAAVVTGRYKTSGHLTSLGDQSGGGGPSPAKAQLSCLRFSRSSHGRRRMEEPMLL